MVAPDLVIVVDKGMVNYVFSKRKQNFCVIDLDEKSIDSEFSLEIEETEPFENINRISHIVDLLKSHFQEMKNES